MKERERERERLRLRVEHFKHNKNLKENESYGMEKYIESIGSCVSIFEMTR